MPSRLSQSRSGLTLIELIVVLVILVGLAGILIPMIPSMLGRVHTSSGATNMVEVTNSVHRHEQLYLKYPDQWDSMTDTTGLISYLPKNSAGALVGGELTATTLSQAEVDALGSVGIQNLHVQPTALPAHPTFDPYVSDLSAPTPISTTSQVAILAPAVAYKELGVTPNAKYVAFGLGKRCTMVGKTCAEPPVIFSDEPGLNPANVYARFITVFKVAEPADTPLSKAVFVGTLHIATEGIHGVNSHLQEYYSASK